MDWKTIVVGLDDLEPADRALERAADIALATKARLVVTSVAPVLTGMAAAHGLGPYDPADPPEAHREELTKARTYLAEKGVPATFQVGFGDPAESIVELARSSQADLIVVGTREPSFGERLLSGSVSLAVAKHARCDVLIVH